MGRVGIGQGPYPIGLIHARQLNNPWIRMQYVSEAEIARRSCEPESVYTEVTQSIYKEPSQEKQTE